MSNKFTKGNTSTQKFAKWLLDNYPKARFTSGDRGGSHSHGQAFDVNLDKLSEREITEVIREAKKRDIRVGEELQGKKGVEGWTGRHFHFDNKEKDSKGRLLPRTFRRDAVKGTATKWDDTGVDSLEGLALEKFYERLDNPKFSQKDYGEQFGPSFGEYTKNDKRFGPTVEDTDLVETLKKQESPILRDIESSKEVNYDNLSFKDAFEKAMQDKGEGETFEWKGNKFLLERADSKPKLEKLESLKQEITTPNRTLEETLKPYSDNMDNIVREETEALKKLEESPSFDPRELQLQKLIDRGEQLVKARDMFYDGGLKKEDNMKTPEELQQMYDIINAAKGGEVEIPLRREEVEPEPSREPAKVESKVEKKPRVRSGGVDESSLEGGLFNTELADYGTPSFDQSDKDSSDLPQEPKSLSMKDLETEYRKLMEASKQERKTAQWATAATTIASMLDKFSARPVGIKPINFQAQESTAAAKDLLQLGRLKTQGQLTPYQQEMLKLNKDREKTREKYYKANLDKESRIANQQQINTMRGFLKDDPTYKKIAEQRLEFDQVGDIIKQAESGNQNAIAALGTKLARAMGEVGVLTDTDVVRYVQGTSWGRQLKTWWEKGATGELPQEVLEDIKANIKTIDSKLEENEKRVFERAAGRIKSAYPEAKDDLVYGVLGYKPSNTKDEKSEVSVGSVISSGGKRYRVINENGDLEEIK